MAHAPDDAPVRQNAARHTEKRFRLSIVLDSDINLNVVDKLPSIRQPTLVIGGEKDPFYGADNIRETARLIPNAEPCLLKNGGHAVVKTQTKAFESAILEFLQN